MTIYTSPPSPKVNTQTLKHVHSHKHFPVVGIEPTALASDSRLTAHCAYLSIPGSQKNGIFLLSIDTHELYITANRPDIVLVHQSVRRAIIVDITIPHDDNLVKAEKEKVTKYLELAHEITAMWNVESTVVPIVVSVNGLLAKSFAQHLKKLSLGCWIMGRIQKEVVLETARIVRRFLTLEP
ncbi:jg11459 [Pararge aegeria aegeria]|uniref:Jg11459 protein n=1 Tax=Pararge aegeria aegeria TaxID=348720 RepID=A0A8S4RZK2_9NEOP|nr:jg11459 [Pararge aegeria aegeria]